MAFFVAEFRCFVDKMNVRVYPCCAACAVFFGSTAAIPAIVKWIVGGMGEYKYLYYYFVLLALILYSLARFLSFAFMIDKGGKNAEVKEVVVVEPLTEESEREI